MVSYRMVTSHIFNMCVCVRILHTVLKNLAFLVDTGNKLLLFVCDGAGHQNLSVLTKVSQFAKVC